MSNNNSGKVELDDNIIAMPTTYSDCERCGRRLPDYAVCLCVEKIYSQQEVDKLVIEARKSELEMFKKIPVAKMSKEVAGHISRRYGRLSHKERED